MAVWCVQYGRMQNASCVQSVLCGAVHLIHLFVNVSVSLSARLYPVYAANVAGKTPHRTAPHSTAPHCGAAGATATGQGRAQ